MNLNPRRRWQMRSGCGPHRLLCGAGLLVVLGMASMMRAQGLPQDPSAATVTGTVTDTDGALVVGAAVILDNVATKQSRTAVSDSQGRYRFTGVTSGELTVRVTAPNFAAGTAAFTVLPGQVYEAAAIALRAMSNSEVMVTLSQAEIADEQVHLAEKQRVIGFIPNYFVSYETTFTPLNARQKFSLGWHEVLDPTHFLGAGFAAGVEQANNTLPGYGQGAAGYGKRFGAALALSTSSTLMRGSIFPALFRQDPRYFYKGTGTVWQRTEYAIESAVRCKGDNGKWQPNYGGILGDFAAGALTNAYYPESSRNGAVLTVENGLLSTVGVAGGHVLQEFLFKRFTSHSQRNPAKP